MCIRDSYLKREGAEHKAEHVQKIQDYHKNWREAIMNAAIKEAKKHGVEKVSTHSPESKSSHANYGSSKIHSTYKKGYKQVPRAMGFQPVHHSELPINESGRKHFEKEDPYKEKYINDHLAAHDHHMSMWKAHDSLSNDVDQQQYKDRHLLNAKGHLDTAQQHAERLKQLDPVFTPADKNKIQPDSHHWDVARDLGATNDFFSHDNDNLLADPTPKFKDASNEGHTYHIIPKLKKYIQEITDLYKSSKSKWLERFEELSKGSRQSKIPFNPKKDISDTDRSDVENWTGGYGYQDRNMIPKIPENAKKRALDKLHKLTDVKKHPITGERMFLMHRGMGEGEYNEDHYQTGISCLLYTSDAADDSLV